MFKEKSKSPNNRNESINIQFCWLAVLNWTSKLNIACRNTATKVKYPTQMSNAYLGDLLVKINKIILLLKNFW